MKKLLLLILLVIFACGWSPTGVFSVYKNLKNNVVLQLNELFDREISVESVSGTLVNQIELNNVVIAKNKKLSEGHIIKAKKIVLNYSPIKLAASRGNIIAALTKILVIEPEVFVERSQGEVWNVAGLIPKAPDGKTGPSPLSINADVVIREGYGAYTDSMGFNDNIKGKKFVSKFKDLNANIRISGDKITVSNTVTSLVENAVAYARVNGSVNSKTGKYSFTIYANNVDLSRWGWYTLSIPHFTPISGTSDMKLVLTPPPPVRKDLPPGRPGQPILLDGKFTIKNGKALIFGREIDGINGNINIYDEDARFKNLVGFRDKVMLKANGRIYDFIIANYDLSINIPPVSINKIKQSVPEFKELDISGVASSNIKIGGNYGHPLFSGDININGDAFGQNISGIIGFEQEGTTLMFSSSALKLLNNSFQSNALIGFADKVPSVNIKLSSKAFVPERSLSFLSAGPYSMDAEIKGKADDLMLDVQAAAIPTGSFRLQGTLKNNGLDLLMTGSNLSFKHPLTEGMMTNFAGTLTGGIKGGSLSGIVMTGEVDTVDTKIASQPFSFTRLSFDVKENRVNIRSGELIKGSSTVKIKGTLDPSLGFAFDLALLSGEASDLAVIEKALPKELTPVFGKFSSFLTLAGKIKDGSIDPTTLNIFGSVDLKDGFISYERVKNAYLAFDWSPARMELDKCQIKTMSSNLVFSGTVESKTGLDIAVEGQIDLSNLKPFTLKYGRLTGVSSIKGRFEGPLTDPRYDIDFEANNIGFNNVSLDGASGRILYDGNNFYIARPLELNKDNDNYVLSGKYSIKPKTGIAVKLDVIQGELGTALALFDAINAEISSKNVPGYTPAGQKVTISTEKLKFPLSPLKTLYESKNEGSSVTVAGISGADTFRIFSGLKTPEDRHIQGKFSGKLEIEGDLKNPSGKLVLLVSNGSIEAYRFDEAFIKGTLNAGTFEAERVYIKKSDGMISLSGRFNLSSTASVELEASEMPVDLLSLIIGPDKSYKGVFNLRSSFSGPVSSLSGKLAVNAHNVILGGVPLDEIKMNMAYADDTITIKDARFKKGDKESVLLGILPMIKGPVSMTLSLEGESIGLFTLPFRSISWISGSGQGVLDITGSLERPKMNGNLIIEDASIHVNAIDSDIQSINSSIRIKNNTLDIDAFLARWKGKWTQGNANKIKISGSLDLGNIFSSDRYLDINMAIADSPFIVELPGLYRGDVDIKDLALKGRTGLSAGDKRAPQISGQLDLTNGTIILPDFSKRSAMPPIGLDLVLNIKKNTYVEAGETKNLLSTDLSNLMLNLEIEGKEIRIKGDINEPNITGKTYFKHGRVTILNREFTLMNEDRQKTIYASDIERINENSANFSGGKLPSLSLASEVKVKSTEIVGTPAPGETPNYKTTNYLVVSRISGTPYTDDKDIGIKLFFDAFVEDASKQPPELIASGFDDQEVKVLLLPDFIKQPLGINEKGAAQVDANDVLVDYLNSRLNSYLLRDVERGLAKSLELESLSLEYNFGKDIRNMLPANNVTELGPQEMPETMYGISAVKGFFDLFYIDVKYSQAVQEQAVINRAFFNYQLTYKLNPVLSVVYYREPFSFIEETSDYYKVTLKAGYQL